MGAWEVIKNRPETIENLEARRVRPPPWAVLRGSAVILYLVLIFVAADPKTQSTHERIIRAVNGDYEGPKLGYKYT